MSDMVCKIRSAISNEGIMRALQIIDMVVLNANRKAPSDHEWEIDSMNPNNQRCKWCGATRAKHPY